jgi:hypothetical protein
MATVATVQATDLGGLGNASGGRPDNGGARGIPSCSDACTSGIEIASDASAAPQQAMPALQQLPPHRVVTPAGALDESGVALKTACCSCVRMSAARVSAAHVSGDVDSGSGAATCDG